MEEPRHKRSHMVGFHLYEMPRISKPIETENSRGCQGTEEEGDGKVTKGFFWSDENVLESDSGDGCTIFEYTKTHQTVVKWVNFMECKIDHNSKKLDSHR